MLKGLIERTVASGALGRDANVATVARAAQRAGTFTFISRESHKGHAGWSAVPLAWGEGTRERFHVKTQRRPSGSTV